MLELDVGLEDLVADSCCGAEEHVGALDALGVGRDQQADGNSLAAFEETGSRGQEEQHRGGRVVDVRGALQDAVALAQHVDQAPPLVPPRVGRGQRARAVTVPIELVDRGVHSRHPEHAGIECLVEHVSHAVEFRAGGEGPVVGGAAKSHDGGAQIRMPKERGHIRAERQRVDLLDVAFRIGPVLELVERADHMLARHCLYTAEQVGGVVGLGVDGRHGTAAQHEGGDAVAHRLIEAGVEQHLGVVVGVHIDEPGQNPLAAGIDHLGAIGLVERRGGDGGNPPLFDPEIGLTRFGIGAVEPEAIANDEVVVAHGGCPSLGVMASLKKDGNQSQC